MPNQPDPTVRDMLRAKIDELTSIATRNLEEIRTVTEQLEPERARSCRNTLQYPPPFERAIAGTNHRTRRSARRLPQPRGARLMPHVGGPGRGVAPPAGSGTPNNCVGDVPQCGIFATLWNQDRCRHPRFTGVSSNTSTRYSAAKPSKSRDRAVSRSTHSRQSRGEHQ
jgi:hypothetical protein